MNSAASDDGAGAKLGDLGRERNLVTLYLKEIGAFGVLTATEEAGACAGTPALTLGRTTSTLVATALPPSRSTVTVA